MLLQDGRPEEARPDLERALAIKEASVGEASAATASTRLTPGRALSALGKHEEALRQIEFALEIREQELGPEHPTLAMTLNALAGVLGETGRIDEARERAARARRVREKALGADHPFVAQDLSLIARLAVEAGDAAAAIDAGLASEAVGRAHVRNTARTLAERELAERSARFRAQEQQRQPGLDDVLAALPSGDSALVAWVRFANRAAGVEEYAAFVRTPGDGPISIVRLGAADEVDRRIEAWREQLGEKPPAMRALRARAEADGREAGKLVRELLWEPVAKLLPERGRVFVAPDGALNLINLAALPADGDGYLVETGLRLHHLTAERNLVRRPSASGSGLLLVGDAEFGTGSPQRFLPLPATAAEIDELRRDLDVAVAQEVVGP
jgi:tetratricopeptide (TPR) repeat protein